MTDSSIQTPDAADPPFEEAAARWVVSAREQIQTVLVDLRLLLKIHDDLHTKQEKFLVGHLIGAAFSLWRAAFLTESRRGWKNVLEDAKRFLDILIRDNAIGYPQDRSTRAWTAGYYVNNARYRITKIVQDRPHLMNNVKLSKMSEVFESSIAQLPLRNSWDSTFSALNIVLDDVKNSLSNSDG